MNELLNNYAFISAIIANLLAQALKVPTAYIFHRTFNLRVSVSTGGMPSSHAATVCALATSVALAEGIGSIPFAIASLFAIVTMYDAAGIRRHAGTHAHILNRLLHKYPELRPSEEVKDNLKEMLGHRPIEVLAGAMFGIIVSIVYFMLVVH